MTRRSNCRWPSQDLEKPWDREAESIRVVESEIWGNLLRWSVFGNGDGAVKDALRGFWLLVGEVGRQDELNSAGRQSSVRRGERA